MTAFIVFRCFAFLCMELFIWINLHGKQIQKISFTLCEEYSLNMLHIPQPWNTTILQKTAMPRIHLWVISIVKITYLHWLYSYNPKKTWNEKTNKKYIYDPVFWFGPFHQVAVPGLIFCCMSQFPVDTKSSKIHHH